MTRFRDTVDVPLLLHQERGFTLIEALVALLVLSVGLLGMAALHAQALSVTRAAQLRSHAFDLAADMAERLRANAPARATYAAADDSDTRVQPPACGGPGSVPAAPCSPSHMAVDDLAQWRRQVGRLLPAGAAGVLPIPGLSSAYVVEVRWDEVGAGAVVHRLEVRLGEE